MADPGNRFGFDLVTSLVSSGLTLLLSAAGVMFSHRVQWSLGQLYTIGGAAILGIGLVLGIGFVIAGLK
jgi:hypothetical protein